MKTDKPLTATEGKALIETFRRNSRDITVYEAKNLSESQRKSLLQHEHTWIVVGKSKWT
jgi:hypothetical protein